jgi:phosphate transport system substrate-binding protein
MPHPFIARRWFCTFGIVAIVLLPPCISSADTLKYGGSSGGITTIQVLLQEFQKKEARLSGMELIPNLSSGGGIKAVSSGAADLSVSSRLLSRDEEKKVSATAYGKTPFVFAVSSANPVAGYSNAELASVLSGKIAKWPNGSRIRLVLPLREDNDNSIIRSVSSDMASALDKAHAKPGMLVKATDQDQADALESVPGAFGTSTLALIVAGKRKLKPLSLNGVSPSPENLANGSYPLYKTFYIVTKPKPGLLVQRFLDFVTSSEGRALLLQNGHVNP